jgi:hypothetical protein
MLICGLAASDEMIRPLALHELMKCCCKEEYMKLMMRSDVFPVALECLSDESTSIAVKVTDLLLNVSI